MQMNGIVRRRAESVGGRASRMKTNERTQQGSDYRRGVWRTFCRPALELKSGGRYADRSAELSFFFNHCSIKIVIPSVTGACSFSENLTYYVTRTVLGGGGAYPYLVQGSVQSGPSISGSISEPGGPQTFIGIPQSPFSTTALTSRMSLVDTSSPVSCLSPGCVQVQVVPSGTGNSADMTLSGTGGFNCNVSGTFTQEGSNAANLNVFDVSLTFTGTTCAVTGTIKGLRFESPSDYFNFTPYPPSGTFLYAISPNSADVLVFYP
jgi:hypothetical protein